MINFSLSNDGKTLISGQTRMFGSPDVPDFFEWPTCNTRYGDEIDMTFLCQINCKDIESEFLPSSGILYFFYNAAECPATPNIKDAAKVFWFDEDEGDLTTLRLVDADGEDMSPPALSLTVTEGDYDVSISTVFEDIVQLSDDVDDDSFEEEFEDFDDFEDFKLDGENSDDDMVVLASFKEYEDENISFTFEKGSELCFLIKKSSLEKMDFSDIRVLIV